MVAASQRLREGAISLQDWQRTMMRETKSIHLYSAAAAKGGWAKMDFADYGRMGPAVRSQYGYLDRFSRQIASGEAPMDGRLIQRTRLYAQSGRSSYHIMEARDKAARGFTHERNLLAPVESCGDCIAETDRDWVPIGTLIPVGQRQCVSNCACTIEYGPGSALPGDGPGGVESSPVRSGPVADAEDVVTRVQMEQMRTDLRSLERERDRIKQILKSQGRKLDTPDYIAARNAATQLRKRIQSVRVLDDIVDVPGLNAIQKEYLDLIRERDALKAQLQAAGQNLDTKEYLAARNAATKLRKEMKAKGIPIPDQVGDDVIKKAVAKTKKAPEVAPDGPRVSFRSDGRPDVDDKWVKEMEAWLDKKTEGVSVYEDIVAERDRIQKAIIARKKVVEEAGGWSGGDKQIKELIAQRNAAIAKLRGSRGRSVLDDRKALFANQEFKREMDLDFNTRTGRVKEKAKEGREAVAGMVHPKYRRDLGSVTVRREDGRAYYLRRTRSINMDQYDDVATYVHEMGHHLEYEVKEIQDAAFRFLEARTKGYKARTMREITGRKFYKVDEIATEDKFFSPYVGKHYLNTNLPYNSLTAAQRADLRRSSEVISMGLEAMYRDPRKFLKEDPEHFGLIWSIITGQL